MSAANIAQPAGFIALPGSAQTHYDDATVMFCFKDLLLLAMFDISTSRPLPKDMLLTTFKASVDDAIARSELFTALGSLLNTLQCFAEKLNEQLRCGCVSITVAFIDAQRVWGYCAGDVRMGYVREGALNWLSPVHTAANVFVPFTDGLKSSPSRHILTRCLKLHRTFQPEYFQFDLPDESLLVCATDGFWCDPHWGNSQSLVREPSQRPIDDCTCLWFNPNALLAKTVQPLAHNELHVFTQYDHLELRA
jgi:hypothetical protein